MSGLSITQWPSRRICVSTSKSLYLYGLEVQVPTGAHSCQNHSKNLSKLLSCSNWRGTLVFLHSETSMPKKNVTKLSGLLAFDFHEVYILVKMKNLKSWRDMSCLQIGQLNSFKTSFIPKLLYRIHTISLITQQFLSLYQLLILKSIYINKRFRIVKIILKQKKVLKRLYYII